MTVAPVGGYSVSPDNTFYLMPKYVPRCGMSFRKLGKFFPSAAGDGFPPVGRSFAQEIALALNRASVESAVHIKTVAVWTGANERTVKNWFAGTYGPNGEHLLILARHCDQVLNAMIVMMDRRELLVGPRVADIERRVRELAYLLGGLHGK